MSLKFAARFAVIVLAPEVIAVGHRRHSAVEGQNFQAVTRKIEITNDFRTQQRDDVRKNREFETGNDFFRDCRAAEHIAFFQDQDFLACFCKICRIYEAVVASSDNDDVVFFGHEIFLGDRRFDG